MGLRRRRRMRASRAANRVARRPTAPDSSLTARRNPWRIDRRTLLAGTALASTLIAGGLLAPAPASAQQAISIVGSPTPVDIDNANDCIFAGTASRSPRTVTARSSTSATAAISRPVKRVFIRQRSLPIQRSISSTPASSPPAIAVLTMATASSPGRQVPIAPSRSTTAQQSIPPLVRAFCLRRLLFWRGQQSGYDQQFGRHQLSVRKHLWRRLWREQPGGHNQ